jgi:hypothetical protein
MTNDSDKIPSVQGSSISGWRIRWWSVSFRQLLTSFGVWVHRVLSRSLELYRLKAVKMPQCPELPTLEQIDPIQAVWRVTVPNQTPRFMSIKSDENNQDSFVVQVDADRLYRNWLKSSAAIWQRNPRDCICRADMPSDRKYKYAANGFAHGIRNPVPLAIAMAYYKTNGRLCIDFEDGVTRTFWLLSNRCPAFPVKVYGINNAKLLHQFVGLASGPISLAELFADVR